jgi:Lar family restriction alleviation protein
MQNLEPCPFCGGRAALDREGTRQQSSIIFCSDCGARVEANETGEFNGDHWNRRFPRLSLSPMESESSDNLTRLSSIALILFSGVQVGFWLWHIYFNRK